MALRALLDVNALLALLDDQHVHHNAMRHWWRTNRSFGWASCPLSQNGFLRILSQPSYPRSMALADAFGILEQATGSKDHEFWADDYSICDGSAVRRNYILGPNQITDVYLLALAVRNDGRLVTFDRAISHESVKGGEAKHLVRLA